MKPVIKREKRRAKAKSEEQQKGPLTRPSAQSGLSYKVDSISNPQASNRGSGMYLEFLFFRAHSRKRMERMYWSGWSLNSFTTCSNSVMVGTTGPIGSGLPQLGLPRRFAIVQFVPPSGCIFWTPCVAPVLSCSSLSTWIRKASTTIQGALSGTFPGAQTRGTGSEVSVEPGTIYPGFGLSTSKILRLAQRGTSNSIPAVSPLESDGY